MVWPPGECDLLNRQVFRTRAEANYEDSACLATQLRFLWLVLPVRQFDDHIGLTHAFAAALDVRRDPHQIDTPSWTWSAPASTASSPTTRTKTTTIPSAMTPSSSWGRSFSGT